MYQNLPPTGKDKYWNESTAQPPYTMATMAETLKPSFMGSTFDMRYVQLENQMQLLCSEKGVQQKSSPTSTYLLKVY